MAPSGLGTAARPGKPATVARMHSACHAQCLPLLNVWDCLTGLLPRGRGVCWQRPAAGVAHGMVVVNSMHAGVMHGTHSD